MPEVSLAGACRAEQALLVWWTSKEGLVHLWTMLKAV